MVKQAKSQTGPADSTQKQTANQLKVNQNDLTDVFLRLFKLSPSIKSTDIVPGEKPVFTIFPAIGYTLQTRYAAILSSNLVFYTSTKSNSRLSVLNISPTYSVNKQFIFPVLLNIWLKGDQYNLTGDWRYMKYPQSTYGLGSNSTLDMENPMNFNYLRIYQYLTRKIVYSFTFGLGYTLDYHWNISEEGTANGTISDYKKYGVSSQTVSSGLALILAHDSRKNPVNPKQGDNIQIIYRDNMKFLGSESNWQSLLINISKYIPLNKKQTQTLAFWNYDWIILNGKPPYLDLPSTGWDNAYNTGRGFIQGRFRGNAMLYFETEYRFSITRNEILGGVLFSNIETVSGAPSYQFQKLQPGYGLGLRIKLNKKSNTNLAVDYGFGTHGMRGFFVNLGEVF
jgi:outer membrane protein assembly factor BamA